MSTETILSDEQRRGIEYTSHVRYAAGDKNLVKNVMSLTEQAVLQSEQVQAWKRDSERYQWLKGQFRIMSLDMEGNHKWVIQRPLQSRGPTIDSVCDAEMEKQT